MVDDESPITGHTTALRRAKYVPSRELGAGEIEIYDPDASGGDQGFIRIKDAHGNKIELANATIRIEGVGAVIINGATVTIANRMARPTAAYRSNVWIAS